MLPSNQGSLLNVVLDDYLRLKKLFAARLVTKSTSHGDQSSVTEVGDVTGCCVCSSSAPLFLTAGWLCLHPVLSIETLGSPAVQRDLCSQHSHVTLLMFPRLFHSVLTALHCFTDVFAALSWCFRLTCCKIVLLIFFFSFFLTLSSIHFLPIYNSMHPSIYPSCIHLWLYMSIIPSHHSCIHPFKIVSIILSFHPSYIHPPIHPSF